MNARELRRKYLEFFQSKGHALHPSGSLIPYDVTGRLDASLLFNGAGMVQFKPYFRGTSAPPSKTLTNCQKCMRTGDIDEVGDRTHLTFFEMLGNFSFGDYFKTQAIDYSWEFLTAKEWLGLDPYRLAFTVFELDDEAYDAWAAHLEAIGITPDTRIFRLGEDSNYWPAGAFSNGPPGPCGPNSEMFYWVSKSPAPPSGPNGAYNGADYLRDLDSENWLEIWNDVFIQYEWQGSYKNPDRPSDGYRKEGMPSLPFQSIDTGMGVERTATALCGFSDLYQVDTMLPIIRKLESISTRNLVYGESELTDRAMRIITDHTRSAVFCIADGILPSNAGRGYVLRRLIRRAVLKGQRTLGFERPFLDQVFEGVQEAFGGHYAEITERRDVIVETIRMEEVLFRRTLGHGMVKLEQMLSSNPQALSGEQAFLLHDTFGFPLEVTRELCSEAGVDVDEEGYENLLRQAQERSRRAHAMDTVYGGVTIRLQFGESTDGHATPTEFVGYETATCEATIVGGLAHLGDDGMSTGELAIALNRTPFYAESGGQVSDTGGIKGERFDLKVIDVTKQDGVYVHLVQPSGHSAAGWKGLSREEAERKVASELFGKPVLAQVDAARRRHITRNHTATHLMHAALRQVLGTHVTQAGSLVAPDHLRFDFTHGTAMTLEQVAEVERCVNEQVLQNAPVFIHLNVPLEEAKRRGAMALFGEKYADYVRVVEIPGCSVELCGGIHVGATGEIGLFKIVHEGSAAGGVRRIEALTGEGAYRWTLELERKVRNASQLLKATPTELVSAVERIIENQRELKQRIDRLRTHAADTAEVAGTQVGPVEIVVQTVSEGELTEATAIADRLVDGKQSRVAVVGLQSAGKVAFVVKAGSEAVKAGAHAGNIVRELAKLVGGGGGGRPDFATAGGKDVHEFAAALEQSPNVLAAQLGVSL